MADAARERGRPGVGDVLQSGGDDEVAELAEGDEALHGLRFGAGPLATSIELFDVYRGAQLGEGEKSLAYRVRFTAPDRALTDADIQKFRPKIEKSLKRVGGSLRT